MTEKNSKVEARRRVREAQARTNEARAQRERDNIEDAATYLVAVGKVSEVDAWESERLGTLRDQVRIEACRRRAHHQAAAGVAVAQMQRRGETLQTIAELTGRGIGEVRAMLRHTPKVKTVTAKKDSHVPRNVDGHADPAAGPSGGATSVPEVSSAEASSYQSS